MVGMFAHNVSGTWHHRSVHLKVSKMINVTHILLQSKIERSNQIFQIITICDTCGVTNVILVSIMYPHVGREETEFTSDENSEKNSDPSLESQRLSQPNASSSLAWVPLRTLSGLPSSLSLGPVAMTCLWVSSLSSRTVVLLYSSWCPFMCLACCLYTERALKKSPQTDWLISQWIILFHYLNSNSVLSQWTKIPS